MKRAREAAARQQSSAAEPSSNGARKHRPILRNYLAEFEKVYAGFGAFHADDVLASRFIAGILVSTFLARAQELAWGLLVAPPAARKTESLRPLFTWDRVIMADDLTGRAMASGYDPEGLRTIARSAGDEENDPSLLSRLDGHILLCKDMAAILSEKDLARKIFGQLRGSFDGSYSMHSGTLGEQHYKARFGFIGATTPPSYDSTMSKMQDQGDRILTFRLAREPLTLVEAAALNKRVLTNRNTKHLRRDTMSGAVPAMLETMIQVVEAWGATQPYHQPREVYDPVIETVTLTVMVKSVAGEMAPTGAEHPARLVQQIAGILDTLSLCEGRKFWNGIDVQLAKRVCHDTIPQHLLRWLQYIATRSWQSLLDGPNSHDISDKLGFTRPKPIDNQLRQWDECGLIERNGDGCCKVRRDMLGRLEAAGLIVRPTALH